MDLSTQLLVLISCSIVCGAQELTSQQRVGGGLFHAGNHFAGQQLHPTGSNITPVQRDVNNSSVPVHGHALEEITDDEMRLDQSQAYEHNAHYGPHPAYHQPYPAYPPAPPRPQTYPPWTAGYHEPGLPVPFHDNLLYHPASKLSLFNPPTAAVGIGKPIDSKLVAKPSGLGGILGSLLGGAAPGGLQLDGIKDLFINGFLKPLLVAKGGIKTLISKLIVPVLALVLINLEILVVVWWLWEECPKGLPPPPPPLPTPPPPSAPYPYSSYPKAAFNYY